MWFEHAYQNLNKYIDKIFGFYIYDILTYFHAQKFRINIVESVDYSPFQIVNKKKNCASKMKRIDR